MPFGHKKLDVYQLSLGYVAWVYSKVNHLNGPNRHARDQWLRASQSIPLNIAEGNGKASSADRRKFFEIARGSVFECAAIQDVLQIGNGITEAENIEQPKILDRLSGMLSKLGGRGYVVHEESETYNTRFDSDHDTDSDTEKPFTKEPPS